MEDPTYLDGNRRFGWEGRTCTSHVHGMEAGDAIRPIGPSPDTSM